MNDTSTHMGVVDPTIFEDDLQGGVPLNSDGRPSFATQVDETTGQTEVVVEDAGVDTQRTHADDQGPEQVHVTEEQLTGIRANTLSVQHAPVQHAPVQEEAEQQEHELPPTNHNRPADPAEMRRDFFKDVNKFGKASGEGASALGRLGLRSLRAAADGILSTAKPATGKDDATLVYEAYAAMDSKHAEHTAGGAKANASKLRQIIGMGCMTTLSDPVAIGDKVVRIREEMEGADLKPKALFAALVDVAREQQASDTELTDDAIKGCLTKTKADKTLEKEWEAINKRVEGLITGEASHGLKDTSDVALKISELCAERLKQYKSDGTRQDRIDSMIELGYTTAQAEAIVDKKFV